MQPGKGGKRGGGGGDEEENNVLPHPLPLMHHMVLFLLYPHHAGNVRLELHLGGNLIQTPGFE